MSASSQSLRFSLSLRYNLENQYLAVRIECLLKYTASVPPLRPDPGTTITQSSTTTLEVHLIKYSRHNMQMTF